MYWFQIQESRIRLPHVVAQCALVPLIFSESIHPAMSRRSASADFSSLDSMDNYSLGEQLTALVRQAREQRRTNAGNDNATDNLRLKSYQTARLAQRHADLHGNPRYRPAVDFFLTDVYSPKDFSTRDVELARVVPLMVRMLPNRALATLVNAVRMDALTESLDADMVNAMRRVGSKSSITADSYARAYKLCARAADRERQITLIRDIGQALDWLRRVPMLKPTLRMMRTPARYAGFENLQFFLENGYAAFYHMGGASEFLDTIVSRELEFSRQNFSR